MGCRQVINIEVCIRLMRARACVYIYRLNELTNSITFENTFYTFTIPFADGTMYTCNQNRTCIGQRLAMMESVQIVSSIIKSFRIELAFPENEVAEVADISLGPKKGLFLKLSKW